MAVVSSCRKVLLSPKQRAQPSCLVAIVEFGTPEQTAVISRRKVRMTSSHHALMPRGLHTRYNGRDKGSRSREGELTPKPVLSSDCRVQLARMKPESLVIAGQPYGGEFVPAPGPCTHRPSHYGELAMPEVVTLTAREGMPKAQGYGRLARRAISSVVERPLIIASLCLGCSRGLSANSWIVQCAHHRLLRCGSSKAH
ncbi:hypothetical protein H5410_063966 [Solanum commersonii]|uniref:Uncharacterized protein n=1 Tax=Solanum commersonii TaxID=4109 RepID=A0A9J5W1H9_SOLCO|nr:hypothetical protein H5410_063966 [Solanum commersonii]